MGEKGTEDLKNNHYVTTSYCDKIFDVYETENMMDLNIQHILCFVDLTNLKKAAADLSIGFKKIFEYASYGAKKQSLYI